MITADGWLKYSIWEHSASVRDLYERRCRLDAEEMTCAAQCAELLAPHVSAGDTLLDAGCGSGYFFHSLRTRSIPADYIGIDSSPSLIDIGRRVLPQFGLPPDRLQVMRIEDLDGQVDHVVCMNVLSNIDNYHRPLERLLRCARKTLILRESAKESAEYAYVRDNYLDDGADLKVHVNAYPIEGLTALMESEGFRVTQVQDRYSGGRPQAVIDHLHYWTFFVAVRA